MVDQFLNVFAIKNRTAIFFLSQQKKSRLVTNAVLVLGEFETQAYLKLVCVTDIVTTGLT